MGTSSPSVAASPSPREPRVSAAAPPPVDSSSARGTSRRLLSRGLVGGLAVTAVGPLLGAQDAAATTADARSAARTKRRHRSVCRHWHRCPQHPRHTCRRKHRCRHQHHRAPRRTTDPSPTSPAPTPQPAPGPTPADPPIEIPTETPAQPPAETPSEPPTETPTEPPTETPTEPPVPQPDPDFTSAPLPTPASLHLASRFSYGITPQLHAEMQAAGSPAGWFEQQLDPASIPDPDGDATASWWFSIGASAAQVVQRDEEEVESGWSAMANYARWCLARRIVSRRQVLEVMAEFWEHHLHVPVHDDGVHPFRADYGKLVRSHALGRFDDLLVAAITHPAMGVSLDNASSTKRAPNENLGRELLELHTLGTGHHTEDDVKNAARILTGYRVRTWSTWQVWYDAASHWTGPVRVAGFAHPNAATDGRPVAEAFLRHLAHHPDTARRIARKLAVRFVSDDPSPALVDHLAQVFTEHGTEIKPVLRALVAHPEFAAAAGAKVRTPTDDVAATYRALQVRLARPTTDQAAANAMIWQAADIGQAPFDWPRPDGQPQDNRSWSSVSRLLASFDAHYSIVNGWWPKIDITYRRPAQWLPAASVRFDVLVEHLCGQLLGRSASPRLLQAACEATGLGPATVITERHALVRWSFGMLLTTLLDTPEHLHR